MGKDKNKIRNNEEEIKIGEISLRKLVEVYSYNVVVDQFFMKTSKKIVEIDKILRNLKNKTGSAFVAKFLYENREELTNLCKLSKGPNINFYEEKPKISKRLLDKKRKKIKRKNHFSEINEEEKKLENTERRKKYISNKEDDCISLRHYAEQGGNGAGAGKTGDHQKRIQTVDLERRKEKSAPRKNIQRKIRKHQKESIRRNISAFSGHESGDRDISVPEGRDREDPSFQKHFACSRRRFR